MANSPVAALKIALEQVTEFCRKQNVDLEAIPEGDHVTFFNAVNQLMRTDDVRDSFLGHSNDVARLYKAVMPDPVIPLLAPKAQLIAELATGVDTHELHRMLNMGIGMVVVVAAADIADVQASIPEPTWRIGALVRGQAGSRTVHLL